MSEQNTGLKKRAATRATKAPRLNKKTGEPYPKPVRTPSKFAPELYRVEDLAAKASIGVSTAWAMVKEGKIRVVKIGGSTRVPEEELRRVLSEGC